MYIRERENERENIKLESVEHRSGDDRKEKERSIYRERRSVERSQVNKLVCKLYLRHCKTASYYLTSFLFSISIVMLYTTNIFGQYHTSVYIIKFSKVGLRCNTSYNIKTNFIRFNIHYNTLFFNTIVITKLY